ncbi:unnamed protein product [Notodromas monacha]|uniref:Uncharacterized protein n=1 Tax=Notodromas monacha TaxID=399045 RepID=A0A7R9BFN7_9CRUS|nr:unnamed protein product [Notodromas monacha]CAG0914564.1 unnamed protein product [Notodromas monacha]
MDKRKEPCLAGAWWKSTGSFCIDEKNIRTHNFVPRLCLNLEKILVNQSVVDFGTGYGYLGRCLLRLKQRMLPKSGGGHAVEDFDFYSKMNASNAWESPPLIRSFEGFDGALNIENITQGFVKHLDLTLAANLNHSFDWVISFEVAEHIPRRYESVFLYNLVKHSDYGIVLSWASPEYGMVEAHPNPRYNSEVHALMARIGFDRAVDLEKIVSKMNASNAWESPPLIKSFEGFDGALNIENITQGFVKHLDLTLAANLNRSFDWVISFEVAEHIPRRYESVFLYNLVKHSDYGIVLSWASPEYGMVEAHPNPRYNSEVHALMARIGFDRAMDLEKIVRFELENDGHVGEVYKVHTMVFVRRYSKKGNGTH